MQSRALLDSCAVQNNGGVGITVLQSASLTCRNTVVSANYGLSTAGAISADRATAVLLDHTSVTNNLGGGLRLNGVQQVQIEACNIASNSIFNVRWVASANLVIPNNWWGTADESLVPATIIDCKQSPGSIGCVQFLPLLTSPVAVTPQSCAPLQRPQVASGP